MSAIIMFTELWYWLIYTVTQSKFRVICTVYMHYYYNIHVSQHILHEAGHGGFQSINKATLCVDILSCLQTCGSVTNSRWSGTTSLFIYIIYLLYNISTVITL